MCARASMCVKSPTPMHSASKVIRKLAGFAWTERAKVPPRAAYATLAKLYGIPRPILPDFRSNLGSEIAGTIAPMPGGTANLRSERYTREKSRDCCRRPSLARGRAILVRSVVFEIYRANNRQNDAPPLPGLSKSSSFL